MDGLVTKMKSFGCKYLDIRKELGYAFKIRTDTTMDELINIFEQN